MNKSNDRAITLIQLLCNATGAEFEDESLAVDIIAENLEDYTRESKCNIDNVTPRFSVSLVYQNPKANMLRTLVTDANSKEEALGIAIKYFEKETDGFGLILKSVTHLNEG